MKAIILRRPGSLADMQVQETETPEPRRGFALVKLHAASLNPLDYKHALSGITLWKYPHVPGLDGAGTLEGLFPEDALDYPHLPLGTRVAFHQDYRIDGTFAEYTLVPVHALARIPDNLDFNRASTIPCSGVTAYRALQTCASLGPGSTVLVEGAAGGVGTFMVQLAARSGASVIGTCSPENRDYVLSLGARHTIDYNSESIRDRVAELTANKGVDLVLETISSHSATQALSYLAYGGHMVCLSGLPDLGKLQGYTIAPSIHELALSAVFAHGDKPAQAALARDLEYLMDLVQKGELQVHISSLMDLDAIPGALEALRDRHVRSKMVVELIQ